MVGNVGALSVAASTWFGANTEFVHCINMLPFSPVTQDLLHPDFVAFEFSDLDAVVPTAAPQWVAFIRQDQAVVQALAAWNAVQSYGAQFPVDAGTSLSDIFYWIGTRPAPT